jgi:hypothetical protein
MKAQDKESDFKKSFDKTISHFFKKIKIGQKNPNSQTSPSPLIVHTTQACRRNDHG